MNTQPNLLRVVTFALFLAFAAVSHAQTSVVLFDKDRYELTPATRSELDKIIRELKKGTGAEEVALRGHTDPDASDDYNQTLSFNRAIAVRKYMQDHGVKNKIHLESKGETQLASTSTIEPAMGTNRRVEIIRNYSQKNFAFDEFKKEPEVFTLNTKKDTLITCKGGTQVQVASKIFATKDNTTPITLKIQEYTTKSDFILANLTTQTANNEVLETGGMMNITAWQGDKQLELKEGKSVNILFKGRTEDDQMQLFNGDGQDQHVAWTPAPGARDTGWQFGTKTVSIADNIVSLEKWKFVKIKGVKYKITEHTFRGQTSYDTVQAATESVTREMFMSCSKLGWINCDRFKGGRKTDIAIEYKGEFTPNIVAVFTRINSILPYTYRENNRVIFKDIPAGEEITFIGMFKDEEEKNIQFAQKTVDGEDVKSVTLRFQELKPEEVAEKIKGL